MHVSQNACLRKMALLSCLFIARHRTDGRLDIRTDAGRRVDERDSSMIFTTTDFHLHGIISFYNTTMGSSIYCKIFVLNIGYLIILNIGLKKVSLIFLAQKVVLSFSQIT